MSAYELVQRLRQTKYSELVAYGHAAGWIVRVFHGTPNFKDFGLPDIDLGAEELVDVQLAHPLTDVVFLVRFRAEKIGGHWGVFTFDKVRSTDPSVFKHGGSMAQVKHYMTANSMGCPR